MRVHPGCFGKHTSVGILAKFVHVSTTSDAERSAFELITEPVPNNWLLTSYLLYRSIYFIFLFYFIFF